MLLFGAETLSSILLSKILKIKIYRTIILPVVLYGCETLSLTLREGRRLRVFENRVLRRIFGPKRDEGTGEWRKLHSVELNDLTPYQYCSSDKIKKIEMDGACGTFGEKIGAYGDLVGKPEGKRTLGRAGRRWNEDIQEWKSGAWTGFLWLRARTGGGLL